MLLYCFCIIFFSPISKHFTTHVWMWDYTKMLLLSIDSLHVFLSMFSLNIIFLKFYCIYSFITVSSVQSLSHIWLFATPWTAARQASLSITNSWSLLKLMFIELVMPSNHLTLCHPHSPPAFNLSQCQGLLKWVSSTHQLAELSECQLQHQSLQWIFRNDLR